MSTELDALPPALQHYMHMWNELDVTAIRGHLDLAVAEDCLWVDPHNAHVGRDALEQNVRSFREKYGNATLTIASHIDSHHQRYRYDWQIHVAGAPPFEGFDVATLNAEGLIERVDGFFGLLVRLPGA